jgi:hypothetical protein
MPAALSDICSAVDGADECGRLERREASWRNSELQYAGEQVRAASMSRRTDAGDRIVEEVSEVENNAQEIPEFCSRDSQICADVPEATGPITIPESGSRNKRKRPFDMENVLWLLNSADRLF